MTKHRGRGGGEVYMPDVIRRRTYMNKGEGDREDVLPQVTDATFRSRENLD